MLRPTVALVAMLATMPAFAQSSPPLLIGSNGPSSVQTGEATGGGTGAAGGAMAQDQSTGGVDTGTLLVGGVMVGWGAMIGVLVANSENQTHKPVSP